MAQYYVTHSKYRSAINRSKYENALIYTPIKSKKNFGTYKYEHNGEIIWTYDASQDLFNYFTEIKKQGYMLDYDEVLKFEVYKKYSACCNNFAKREYAY